LHGVDRGLASANQVDGFSRLISELGDSIARDRRSRSSLHRAGGAPDDQSTSGPCTTGAVIGSA
jgi:hypothetical protein